MFMWIGAKQSVARQHKTIDTIVLLILIYKTNFIDYHQDVHLNPVQMNNEPVQASRRKKMEIPRDVNFQKYNLLISQLWRSCDEATHLPFASNKNHQWALYGRRKIQSWHFLSTGYQFQWSRLDAQICFVKLLLNYHETFDS